MLGPEEFFEGLGLGLASFFGTGIVGKIRWNWTVKNHQDLGH